MTGNHNTIRCPHCGSKVRTLTSRQLSTLVREIYFDCLDIIDCGHRFVAQLGIARTVVPSLKPAAGVSLPIVARRPNDIVVQGTPAPAAPPAPAPARPIPSTGTEPHPAGPSVH